MRDAQAPPMGGGVMRTTLGYLVLCVGLSAIPAGAQTPNERVDRIAWSRATSLLAGGGVAAVDGQADSWLGGGVAWQGWRRVAIGASGLWQDRPGDASAFGGDLTVELMVAPGDAPLKPFVRAGIGAYRASFQGAEDVPQFYKRRMTASADPTAAPSGTFTDTSWILGVGLDIPVSRHLSVRPDARFMWVRANGDSYAMTFVGVHLGYRVESHPVTPSRK
jgi:hypothetical protein